MTQYVDATADLPASGLSVSMRTSHGPAAVEFLLIFAVFLVHAGLQPPAVNETNYLAKAKHYWNPEWCRGDVFLESADPHAVFYWICGWWTLWLPLPTVAIIGRVLTHLALAEGWRRLSTAVVPAPWWSVLSAALMVAFTARLHMAGEWIVGGFESKGFAFALVFLALAELVRGRWLRVWPLLGLATALHVLVGGWSIIAAAIVWMTSRGDNDRPPLRAMLPSLLLCAALSAAGLIPTLRLDYGAQGSDILQAAEIQVFERLTHHLNPDQFFIRGGLPTYFGWRFMALAVVCLGVWTIQPLDAGRRRFIRFVATALLISAVGLVIHEAGVGILNQRAATAWIMRFYWFRLADAFVPVGAALGVVGYLAGWRARRPALAAMGLVVALGVAIVPLAWETYERATLGVPWGDRRLAPTPARYRDWLDVCHAATVMTPSDALFLTPSGSQTFKWYAERPEVATWKEMPQDAASIVQWWERLVKIHGPPGNWQPPTRLTQEELLALGRAHGARYLLGPNDSRIDLSCIYRNNSFAIYEFEPRR